MSGILEESEMACLSPTVPAVAIAYCCASAMSIQRRTLAVLAQVLRRL